MYEVVRKNTNYSIRTLARDNVWYHASRGTRVRFIINQIVPAGRWYRYET